MCAHEITQELGYHPKKDCAPVFKILSNIYREQHLKSIIKICPISGRNHLMYKLKGNRPSIIKEVKNYNVHELRKKIFNLILESKIPLCKHDIMGILTGKRSKIMDRRYEKAISNAIYYLEMNSKIKLVHLGHCITLGRNHNFYIIEKDPIEYKISPSYKENASIEILNESEKDFDMEIIENFLELDKDRQERLLRILFKIKKKGD
jgi:hypothetical protein